MRINVSGKMRTFPIILGSLLAWISPLVAAEKPNILFIFSDDHALNSISAYGSRLKDVAPTPNIDRIAKEGAILTRSYCCNSICGPSRAAVLTGKHSVHNGYLDNENCTFDGNQQTFPKLLQKAGYQTAVIGKWHLISEPTGFDYFEIFPANSQGWYYNPEFVTKESKHQETGYATDLITEKTLSWLEKRDKTKPFMLMCQHKAVHRNWSPAARHLNDFKDVTIPEPETLFDDYMNRSETLKEQQMSVAKNFSWQSDMKLPGKNEFPQFFTSESQNLEYRRMNEEQRTAWDAAYKPENDKILADLRAGKLTEKDVIRWKYQRYMKDYLRTVKAMDEGIGKVLDYLDKSDLAKNTIVIYCSDQGFYLGEHGWYDKRWMFEESLQMPFLIRWPGVIKANTHNGSIIQNIDYAPTFLDIAGAPIPDDIQGTSIVPVLKAGDKTPDKWRDSIYYFYSGERTHAVAAHEGVRTDRYKLMWFPKTKEWNLFDLEKDPQEMRSVANDPAYAKTLEEMKKKLEELKKQYKIPAT